MQDPSNITGINLLIDPESLRRDIDPKEQELLVINEGKFQEPVRSQVTIFKNEIQSLAKELNIDYEDDDLISFKTSSTAPSSSFMIPSVVKPYRSAAKSSSSSSSAAGSSSSDSASDSDGEMPPPPPPSHNVSNYLPSNGYSAAAKPVKPSEDFKHYTTESLKQSHINTVMGRISGNAASSGTKIFSIDDERRNDWRVGALSEIEELRSLLQSEGEDVSRIFNIDDSSDDQTIIDVRDRLRYKNNRKQNSAFFELVATSAAHGLGDIFNGEREIFGSKPDLTDWHNSVALKLSRRRFETSEFVSAVMKSYDIGSGLRFGFEIVLDMYLHMKSRAAMREVVAPRRLPSEANARNAMADMAISEL